MTENGSPDLDSPLPPRKNSAAWVLLRLATLCLFSYLGLIVIIAAIQRRLIYHPHKGPVPAHLARMSTERIEEIQVPGGDGLTLHGWLTRPAESSRRPDRELVIIFPGNAGHRAFRAPILDGFNQLGCDALICDYRGYAENKGSPSEEGFARDARAIWDFAVNELNVPRERIILLGESIGGGTATRLAWEKSREGTPPAGLILRTTFTSLTDVARRFYPYLPVNWLLVDRYPSIDRIGEITCPILVMHGDLDEIIPYEQGEQLFDAAPAESANGVPKMFLKLPGTGHNDVMLVSDRIVHEAHREFLSRIRDLAPVEQKQD